MSNEITFTDYQEIQNTAFEWAQSYDTKDWNRLRNCLAPKVWIDFRGLKGALHQDLTPGDYVAILSDRKILGDSELKTQHFLGVGKTEVLGDDHVTIEYLIRVAHQRYTDESLTEVANKGHAHGFTQHWYRKIDGAWKIEGVRPKLNWFEYDLFGTLSPPQK